MNNEQMKNLFNEFKRISNQGWIKGVNNLTNGVGLTFEYMLNKNPDSLLFSDYQGIEIKCSQRYSKFPMSLLTVAFEGPNFYEMNTILEKYGKADYKYTDKKILMVNLKCNTPILTNDKYYFELKIDYDKEMLYLKVYDKKMIFIENCGFIYFETLRNRLYYKFRELAIIYASKKIQENHNYFRYYRIEFYEYLGFERFLKLVEENKILLAVNGRVSRSGLEEGRQRNKNLTIRIFKDNIPLLFDIVFTFDNDKKIYTIKEQNL